MEHFMKRKLLILSVAWLMVLPLVAQKVEVYFDDNTPLETTVQDNTDTIVDSLSVPMADTIPAIDTVVPAQPTPYRYKWRDVRTVRDSLRTTLRTTRLALRKEVRHLKDTVRSEVFIVMDSLPHEIRIGWGDMMFENLIWHTEPHPTILSPDYTDQYNEHYRYTQHLFAEYMYNFGYWYSVGILVDYSGVLWDDVTRNGTGKELARLTDRQYHNIVLMPTVRFAYYHSEYVSLYSALGIGLNINTSTELDYKGRTTAVAPAVNISLLGVRIGKGRWFGSVEVGGMIALASSNEVYMLGSRLFTASIGCRL